MKIAHHLFNLAYVCPKVIVRSGLCRFKYAPLPTRFAEGGGYLQVADLAEHFKRCPTIFRSVKQGCITNFFSQRVPASMCSRTISGWSMLAKECGLVQMNLAFRRRSTIATLMSSYIVAKFLLTPPR